MSRTATRIAYALATTPQADSETPWAHLRPRQAPRTRHEAEAVLAQARPILARALQVALGELGATMETIRNAAGDIPIQRALISRAELVLRVLDQIDAEPPRLDPVTALMAAIGHLTTQPAAA